MSESKRCLNCKCKFIPCKHILNQQYCSKKACQSARKVNWLRNQLKYNKDYRDYRRDIQKKWRSNHPNYWVQSKKDATVSIESNKERKYKVKIIVKKGIVNLSKAGEIKRALQLILTPIDKT